MAAEGPQIAQNEGVEKEIERLGIASSKDKL